MRRLGVAIVLCALLSAHSLHAQSNKAPGVAPLPATIADAKTIFIPNTVGSDAAYDTFYTGMKQWGKYAIVDSAANADLIFEITFLPDRTFDSTTHLPSSDVVGPQYVLTISDAKTNAVLWTEIERRRLAAREKEREKEAVISVQRLVEDVKARAAVTQ